MGFWNYKPKVGLVSEHYKDRSVFSSLYNANHKWGIQFLERSAVG